jgi:hypothetical protein
VGHLAGVNYGGRVVVREEGREIVRQRRLPGPRGRYERQEEPLTPRASGNARRCKRFLRCPGRLNQELGDLGTDPLNERLIPGWELELPEEVRVGRGSCHSRRNLSTLMGQVRGAVWWQTRRRPPSGSGERRAARVGLRTSSRARPVENLHTDGLSDVRRGRTGSRCFGVGAPSAGSHPESVY